MRQYDSMRQSAADLRQSKNVSAALKHHFHPALLSVDVFTMHTVHLIISCLDFGKITVPRT